MSKEMDFDCNFLGAGRQKLLVTGRMAIQHLVPRWLHLVAEIDKCHVRAIEDALHGCQVLAGISSSVDAERLGDMHKIQPMLLQLCVLRFGLL
jgi:hypothetical protein